MSFQVMLQQLTAGFGQTLLIFCLDTVIFPAAWYGGLFWTCKQVQTIELDH